MEKADCIPTALPRKKMRLKHSLPEVHSCEPFYRSVGKTRDPSEGAVFAIDVADCQRAPPSVEACPKVVEKNTFFRADTKNVRIRVSLFFWSFGGAVCKICSRVWYEKMDMKMEDFSFCLPRVGNESALIYPVKKTDFWVVCSDVAGFFPSKKITCNICANNSACSKHCN